MKAITLTASSASLGDTLAGAVVAESVRVDGRRLFRKGEVLTSERIGDLAWLDRPIHAVLPEAGDIHEDAAAVRLAAAIAGPGTTCRKPVLSRVNVLAGRKGLLRVDRDAVMALNCVPDVAIFTQIDRIAVLPGKTLAGVKITPIVTRKEHIERAESIAAESPVIQVKPFLPLRVGVFSTEGMGGAAQQRFRDSVRSKVSWYGGSVVDIVDVPRDPGAVREILRRYRDQHVDLVLAGGGNTVDPLDPTLAALQEVGAEMITFGAPLHPGSMLWLAQWQDTPVFNLASCSMFSRSTSADLILPWIMAGEQVRREDIAALGYGGHLDKDMQFRFPSYESDDAGEPDES